MKIERSMKFLWVILLLIFVLSIMYFVINGEKNAETDTQLSQSEKDWLEKQGPLIYSADNNAPPLRFVDKADGQYKGVVIDYVNLLSLNLGVNIEVHPLLWEKALSILKQGESDLCDMFMSEERAEFFLFSEPIYNLRAVVATRSNSKPINEMTFATQKGDYVNEWLLLRYPEIKLIYVEDLSNAIDLLINYKVDAVAGDEPVVLYQIKNKGVNEFIHVLEKPLYENQVVFAIPKSKSELLPILNKGIAAIAASGQLENIQQKWFGISTPIVQTPDYTGQLRKIIVGAGILALFLIGMITWNYNLSREVEKRTREVINSKNNLQITFDGMTEYLVLFDLSLHVVNINKAFIEALKKPKEELIGETCQKIFAAFKSDELITMINDTLINKVPNETERVLNNNYYVIRIFPLNEVNGRLKNILVIIHNITQEKLSEKQMLQTNKMEAIGQLAAGMGHEIRNPLGIIRNHSYILRAKKDDSILRSLDYIDSSVERANRIIDNLLKFSRLTDDKKDWINLHELIGKIIDLEKENFVNHQIQYSFECNPELRIYSNSESIKHILINLISNAVDAIANEGFIKIICSNEEGQILISVEDTGEGLSEIQIANIFNPFYTTKDPDKGTGLGLYIVYNEVKKLNGEISVSSSGAGETIFTIILPSDGKVVAV